MKDLQGQGLPLSVLHLTTREGRNKEAIRAVTSPTLRFSRVMLHSNAKRAAGSDLALRAELIATLDSQSEPSAVRGDRRRRYH